MDDAMFDPAEVYREQADQAARKREKSSTLQTERTGSCCHESGRHPQTVSLVALAGRTDRADAWAAAVPPLAWGAGPASILAGRPSHEPVVLQPNRDFLTERAVE
jgi:hypothetical protein